MEEPGNEASCFGYNYGDIEIWRMTGRATYCVRVQKTHFVRLDYHASAGYSGRDYFTEQNRTLENTEQLCKPSLHSLNSTPLDRARRALHTDTLFAGILAAGKNWLRVLRNRVGGSSRMPNFCRNSNTNHHVPTIWLPACRTRRALSIGVQFVEIRHCSEDVHSRSVFSSVPFRSVK